MVDDLCGGKIPGDLGFDGLRSVFSLLALYTYICLLIPFFFPFSLLLLPSYFALKNFVLPPILLVFPLSSSPLIMHPEACPSSQYSRAPQLIDVDSTFTVESMLNGADVHLKMIPDDWSAGVVNRPSRIVDHSWTVSVHGDTF